MKGTKFILVILTLMLLPIPFLVNLGGTPAVSAAEGGSILALCNRTFLPLVTGGMGASDVASAAGVQAQNSQCDGFPDFNGDGYADLAIGVPTYDVFFNGVTYVDAGIVQVVYGSPAGLNAVAEEAVIEDQIWQRGHGGTPANNDQFGLALAAGDFNRDGYDDLAVGIPFADIDGQGDAGAVKIIYGSTAGLTVEGIQEWSRASDNISGDPEMNDAFGSSLSSGDFDDDGYDDLAIGVPSANVDGVNNAGAVHILYGRQSGLSHLGNELLTQNTNGFVASSAEENDHFGHALAAGDYNGDGIDDLAVGSPFEDNGAAYPDAGAVQVFYGRSGPDLGDWGIIRLGAVENPQHWRVDSDNVEGAMEEGEWFGYSLASGDFNGDGNDDLAVGTPLETHGEGVGAIDGGGAIHIFQGSETGLIATPATPARMWHQDSTGMSDQVESNEFFGTSLASADFDNDGYADLAIGAHGNKVLTVPIGTVHIMKGSASGLTADFDELLYDPVDPAEYDSFGYALSAGDFNGDGFIDLAVGAFDDDPVGPAGLNAGSVFTFYSDEGGFSQLNSQHWYRGYNGLKGTPNAEDNLGASLINMGSH